MGKDGNSKAAQNALGGEGHLDWGALPREIEQGEWGKAPGGDIRAGL